MAAVHPARRTVQLSYDNYGYFTVRARRHASAYKTRVGHPIFGVYLFDWLNDVRPITL